MYKHYIFADNYFTLFVYNPDNKKSCSFARFVDNANDFYQIPQIPDRYLLVLNENTWQTVINDSRENKNYTPREFVEMMREIKGFIEWANL